MFSSLNPVPALPQYRGPLTVGTAEYEIPVSEIPSASRLSDANLTTIKFRTFYPAQPAEKAAFSVPWLPEPHRDWLDAYCTFLRAPASISKLLSYMPMPLKYTMIPAYRNAPLLSKCPPGQWPVLVFSHGLGGSCNAYSHLLGSLASCGIVCVAPEHRDQSAPVSVIRQADGRSKKVTYRHLSHDPNPEVLSSRNAQLRVRLCELDLLYTAISSLNDGTNLANLANRDTPSLTGQLNISPSKVTWAGHSFGSATMVQLLKSVFWHQHVPTANEETHSRSTYEALYTPAENSSLAQQITPTSPLVLLDLWTMPLRGDTTLWLWERPLPCFANDGPTKKNNVLGVMSDEFYKWTTILDRTKAVLSRNPAAQENDKGAIRPDPGPRLFYAPKTSHLAQSDFALIFPWVTRLKAENKAERTLHLNTRAILQLLRENNISVEAIGSLSSNTQDESAPPSKEYGDAGFRADDGDDPAILATHPPSNDKESNSNIRGWVHIPLSGQNQGNSPKADG